MYVCGVLDIYSKVFLLFIILKGFCYCNFLMAKLSQLGLQPKQGLSKQMHPKGWVRPDGVFCKESAVIRILLYREDGFLTVSL